MKLVKLKDQELLNAIENGDTYVQVGNRKFMLFEVEKVLESGNYNVTDVEEQRLISEAITGYNPSLTKEEVLDQLARQKEQ